MTDSTPAPLASFGDLSGYTPTQLDTFSGQLVRAGYDPAAVAEALSPQGTEQAALAAQPPVETAVPIFKTGLTLSEGQLSAAYDNWVKHGGDPEAFKMAAAQDGYIPVDDPRSEEVQAFDKAFGAAKSEEFNINWQGRIPDGFAGHHADIARLDRDMKQALSAMQFPAHIGGSVIEQSLDDARVYGNLDETGRQLWDRQQTANLGRAIGEDKLPEAISNAKIMLSFIKDQNPELFNEMTKAGLFRSARVVMQLHLQAERLFKRTEMK